MPVLSIIVPIYNTEKYLRECVDSILNQSFGDFELILVDDGSADKSADICEEYQRKDDRIVFVKKENGGISSARNAGINMARGEYLIFCDSDDTMTDRALEIIMPYVMENDFDVTMCTYILDYCDGTVPEIEQVDYDESQCRNKCEILTLYMSGIAPWSACRNVIRRKVVEENKLHYDENIKAAEDCDFYFNLCKAADKFGSINQPIIKYRTVRENSISNTYNKENIESISREYDKWIKYFRDIYGNEAKGILSGFANYYYYFIIRVLKSGSREAAAVCDKYKGILKYVTGWKKKIIRTYYNIFGVEKGIILFRGK